MRLFIYSNLYIALAATLLTQASYWLLDVPARWDALSVLVFSATLLVYNLDRLVSASEEDEVAGTDRHTWIREHSTMLWGLAVAGGAGSLASLFFLETSLWSVLIPLGVLSLAYSLPVLVGGEGRKRLKEIPGLKIFVISLVWAAVTAVLPALNAGFEPLSAEVGLLTAERFIYIFAITLPFDVRDIVRDESSGIETIPMMLGVERTRVLSLVSMAVFGGICAWHYGLPTDATSWSMAGFAALTAFLLGLSRPDRTELYYVGLLDGTMFLYYAAAVLPVVLTG
ncbi:MAG: UbiA family prenyltransferase [Myxococcota bacterium]